MLFIYSLLCLCLAFPTRVWSLSYWIDPTCLGKVAEDTMNEIRLMGSEGSTRVKNTADQVMGAAFQQIFKVDRTNSAATTKVTTAFGINAALTTGDFKSSDIRIYCDNDSRWKLVPDIPSAGKKSKNSKKDPDLQMWWDPINYVFRKPGGYGCLDEGTSAQTYYLKDPGVDEGVTIGGQNPDRAVITICDEAFANANQNYLLSTFPDDKDFTTANSKLTIASFDDLISVTLFHELCHLKKSIAIPGTDEEAIGWDEIVSLSAAGALNEADPFAFLGLSAILNKRNFRLSADPTKQAAGEIDFITPPTASTRRKRRAIRFFS